MSTNDSSEIIDRLRTNPFSSSTDDKIVSLATTKYYLNAQKLAKFENMSS